MSILKFKLLKVRERRANRYNQNIICIILIIVFTAFFSSLSLAQDAGDFNRKCEGKYFTIYYQQGVDLLEVVQRIDISPSQYLIFDSNSSEVDPRINLTKTIDALFLEVCDILDMHLYSFQGNIKICRDFNELKKIFYGYFNQELKAASFYVHEFNTINIDMLSLNAGILGHEIAHAIICHYFVVLPPMKIQEVLAGYVEYQLRKSQMKK